MAITIRDAEILRTLVRVQLASTNALCMVFFATPRLTRRRIGILRDRGLVSLHGKGLPGRGSGPNGSYWRLTPLGLQQVSQSFPNERIPNNLVARVANASLRYFEHRDAITGLYLRLIADRDQAPAEIRRRADRIDWQGEYEVQLEYEALEGLKRVERRIVPDATLSTNTARFFIEIDRSTESRTRCRRVLAGYDRCVRTGRYEAACPDKRDPWVVYVTPGQRADSLRRVVDEQRQRALKAVVLTFDEAVTWLSQAVLGEDAPAPPPARGELAEAYLRELYAEYHADLARRQADGEPISTPICMAKIYSFLSTAGRTS